MRPPPAICLVVEDTELDRRFMERVLARQRWPLRVLFAHSLAQARQVMAREKVSILFLDNSLPDGNGADFIQELSDNRVWRRLPVVIVSDWPSPFMFAKARAGNVLEIWSKSDFTVDKVHEVFARRLRRA